MNLGEISIGGTLIKVDELASTCKYVWTVEQKYYCQLAAGDLELYHLIWWGHLANFLFFRRRSSI